MAQSAKASAGSVHKSKLFVENAPGDTGGQETEIVAQINVPEEGGWGWVVAATSFLSIFILDGVIFTFGSLFSDIRDDLNVGESLIALINSIAFAVYFMLGPIASAIINRYGFRECNMIGSGICSFSLLASYFATTYPMVLVCYGLFCGVGASLINMSSGLVVGFYFDKLRSLVLAIAGSGSNFGCMLMYSVNSYLVQLGGWRMTTLIHSGMMATIYFLSFTYIPVVPLIVTTQEDAVAVTNLPSLTATASRKDQTQTTATERLFNTVSSPHFPTAATMVSKGVLTTGSSGRPGPSSKRNIALTISTIGPTAASQRQVKQVQSILNPNAQMKNVEVEVQMEPPKKRSLWARLTHWEKQVPEARPMYKDDVFYTGDIEQLPEYKKSVMATASKDRFPIEYHLAVARTAEAADLTETRGMCTTAMKRVLATMIDTTLLKRRSMLMICTSGCLTYSGLLVPYIFLQERNKLEGIPIEHCSTLISYIGLLNAIGKLIIGALACKVSVFILYITSVVVSGIAAIGFNFSFTIIYQYACATIFGFFGASLQPLRSILLVEVYGLDMLTNASGLLLMFQGVGCLIGTPLASIIKDSLGYTASFWVAGSLLILSGLILIPVPAVARKETAVDNKKTTNNKNTSG